MAAWPAAVLVLGLTAGPPLVASPATAQLHTAASADSAAALETARSAQARYERERVRRVPQDRWGFSGGSCDERVGRMCMRLEGGSDWWWPEAEEPVLVEARERLIRTLTEASRAAPGDPWILGQRVVYLGEAGRWAEAEGVAARCGLAEAWWCHALEGLARHVQGRYEEAQGSFERALVGMPRAQAADWLDLHEVLTGEGRNARERADDRGDAGAESRFWTLSDPLFLVPGNDRLTEHLARRTWALTREGARNPYAMSWGWDLERLLLRYGWEVGWERRSPSAASVATSTSAVGHQDPRGQSFLAPPPVWDGSPDSEPRDWNPGSRTRPRTTYAPAYAGTFLDLEASVAVVPRGDSALLVVRVPGIPDDTTFHADHDHPPAPQPTDFRAHPPRHGLYAVGLAGEGAVAGVDGPGLAGTLTLTVPAGDHVVSVESWDPSRSSAARMRRGLALAPVPRDVAALSDLLLARAVGPLPGTLDGLLGDLLDAPVVAAGDTLRIGWEVHGLGWQEETLRYSLRLREEAGGVLTRLGRSLGVVGDRRGTGLDWSEAGPESTGPVFRAVDLVVPTAMEPGRYTLELELASAGRNTIAARRVVEVR